MKSVFNVLTILLVTFVIKAEAQTSSLLLGDWCFHPDEQNAGVVEKWYSPHFNDNNWVRIKAGKRWEDQGFPKVDGYAWYRKNVEIPKEWQGKKIWLLFGGVNDSYVLFCNGKRINSYGDQTNHTVAEKATVAELSRYLKFGESNTIAMQVYDWGKSGGLWRFPCELTIEPSKLDIVPLLACYVLYENNELWVKVNLDPFGNEWDGGKLDFEIFQQDPLRLVAKDKLGLPRGKNASLVKFQLPKVIYGNNYQVKAFVKNRDDEPIISMVREIKWPARPSWSPEFAQLKVLNNFVTELLNLHIFRENKKNLNFLNPREGWVFFSVSTSRKSPETLLYINSQSEPLVLRSNPETGSKEAMQFLAKGEHSLRIESAANSQLVVRAVPEIIYSQHPSSPHVAPYGKYDWDFLERYVLSHVNTVVTSGTSLEKAELEQWVKEGRHWIVHASLPGLSSAQAPSVDQVYDVWAGNPGVTNPHFNGIIVDEFLMAGKGHYKAWTDAVHRLHMNPGFSNKVFYAYCGDIFRIPNAPTIPFAQNLIRHGDRFALERYLPEQGTEEEARLLLLDRLQHTFNIFRKNIPGGEKHLVICLGYLSDPPETLNRNPSVNYKVYMDMQFQLLATDPTFWGLYGIQEYLSSYADEEVLRWAHRLFRHYCIDGNCNRLSDDPYILPHLENPDFAEGLLGWQVEPAEEGSIQIKNMQGFSWLQGRYPSTSEGDQFVWMKRSAKRPNQIRQTVKALSPGRLYLLKLISADLQNLDKKQKLALSVKLKNVEFVNDRCFQFVYPSCYSHELGPYNRENPAWLNYHRMVFKPKGNTAELVISDWTSPANRCGPVGQELICNFIEIQPYFE